MSSSLISLAENFAAESWKHLQPDLPEPQEVRTVKDLGYPTKAIVIHLVGAGSGGADVIAKRSRARKAVIERAAYEQLLPSLRIRAPEFFGAVEEEGTRFTWIFIEYVQGEPFDRARDAHSRLVTEWLARLHGEAAELPRPAELPDKGPPHFRENLGKAQTRIDDLLEADDLADDARATASEMVSLLETVEKRWVDVIGLCAGFPKTLMHGDFGDKNLVLDPEGELVALDWASAGWGVPAIDLVRVDPPHYQARVAEHWPDLSVETIERAATAGRLFRHVSAIRSAARDLRARPELLDKLERHCRGLTELLREVGWGLPGKDDRLVTTEPAP